MTWRQRWCGLRHGHDRVLAFVPREDPLPPVMVLRCVSCEYDSPGLAPAPRPPLPTQDGDPRRHDVAPCRLVMRKSA